MGVPLAILLNLWSGVQWLFSVWIPQWWRAVESDVQALYHIGD